MLSNNESQNGWEKQKNSSYQQKPSYLNYDSKGKSKQQMHYNARIGNRLHLRKEQTNKLPKWKRKSYSSHQQQNQPTQRVIMGGQPQQYDQRRSYQENSQLGYYQNKYKQAQYKQPPNINSFTHLQDPYGQNIHHQQAKPQIKQQMQRKQMQNKYMQNNIQQLENKMIYGQLNPNQQPKRKKHRLQRKRSINSNISNKQSEVLIQDQGYDQRQQQQQFQQQQQMIQMEQQQPQMQMQQYGYQQQMQPQIQLIPVQYQAQPNSFQQPMPQQNQLPYQIQQTRLGQPIKKFNKKDLNYYQSKYKAPNQTKIKKKKKRRRKNEKKEVIPPKEINFDQVDILQKQQVYPIQQMIVADPQLQYGYYPQPINYPGQQLQKYQLNQDEFHPYSIDDYRKWKKQQGKHRAGRLPINKNTKDYKQKKAKKDKMKEYSRKVKNMNQQKNYIYREEPMYQISKQERMKNYINNISRPWNNQSEFEDPLENFDLQSEQQSYIPEYDPYSNPNRQGNTQTTLQETTEYFDNPNSEDEM